MHIYLFLLLCCAGQIDCVSSTGDARTSLLPTRTTLSPLLLSTTKTRKFTPLVRPSVRRGSQKTKRAKAVVVGRGRVG